MANPISVLSLIVPATAAQVLAAGLDIARTLGLDVDSWQTGDPTRSNYQYFSQVITRLEQTYVEYVRSGFLSTARGEWLKVKALEDFFVEAEGATYATPTLVVSNPSDSYYSIDSAGDFIAKATSIEKTYRNTTGGIVIAPGAVNVEIPLEAQEAGAASSVAANEIDEIVTSLQGVVIVSSTSAGARDEQAESSIREQCIAAASATSPNGPLLAYEYVARSSELTGAIDVTRAKALTVGIGGDIDIYVAGSSGPVIASTLPLVQAAIEKWATPLGFAPAAKNSTAVTLDLTITVRGRNLPGGYEALMSAAIVRYFADEVSIGGRVAISRIHDVCHEAVAGLTSVSVGNYVSDIDLTVGQVPVLGVLTVAEALS